MKTQRTLAFVLALGGMTGLAAAQMKTQKLKGWISDSKCGAANHQTACVTKCINGGASPVFVDSKKTVWKIDNPDAISSKYYGQHVQVKATADKSTDSIHVDKVMMAKSM
jgi:hypothetical protein